jgi:hypothetical protein
MRRPTTCPPLDHDAVVSVLHGRTARLSHWPAVLLIGHSHDGKALRCCLPFMLCLQTCHSCLIAMSGARVLLRSSPVWGCWLLAAGYWLLSGVWRLAVLGVFAVCSH